MKRILTFLFLYCLCLLPQAASAVTCTQQDWDDFLCNLEEYHGTRCINAEFFRIYCNNRTDGCGPVGGCVGMTPPGHWYPIVDNGTPRWRCRCGCFAEESIFRGLDQLSGRELIERKNDQHFIASLDDWSAATTSLRPINTIMHSPENSAILIETKLGKSIKLSKAHPVLIGDENGHFKLMKQASAVAPGDYLINADGFGEKVTRAVTVSYEGEMLNFNVASSQPAHHIVIANDLQLGDLGWQEELSSIGSRILFRTDILKALEKKKLKEELSQ